MDDNILQVNRENRIAVITLNPPEKAQRYQPRNDPCFNGILRNRNI